MTTKFRLRGLLTIAMGASLWAGSFSREARAQSERPYQESIPTVDQQPRLVLPAPSAAPGSESTSATSVVKMTVCPHCGKPLGRAVTVSVPKDRARNGSRQTQRSRETGTIPTTRPRAKPAPASNELDGAIPAPVPAADGFSPGAEAPGAAD
jgi:hypothetical protein